MKSNKHAYCIIAHNDPYCLNALIRLIDDNRNDIFILLDKKSDNLQFNNIKAYKSRVIFPSEKINIYWGDISNVSAELLLFETVLIQETRYDYIHLLSGADLPLHNQDYIHNFFNKLPLGTNLIGFACGDHNQIDLERKTRYHHILMTKYRHKNLIFRKLCSLIRNLWILFQRMVNYKRDWSDYKLAKGANWVSITPEFASYLVTNKDIILYKFKDVPCADEIYKQTLANSSEFINTILTKNNEYIGCMRKIDWSRGRPYVWHNEDLDELLNSDCLFARKFQSNIDKNIIDKICKEVGNNGK